MSDAKHRNVTLQIQNRQASPKTGCASEKNKKQMQMDQHVGLILSTILHLCASGKHSGVKFTCSARTLALRTEDSNLRAVSVLIRIYTFFRNGRGWAEETQQKMGDTQIVAPHVKLLRHLPAFERQCIYMIYTYIHIHHDISPFL